MIKRLLTLFRLKNFMNISVLYTRWVLKETILNIQTSLIRAIFKHIHHLCNTWQVIANYVIRDQLYGYWNGFKQGRFW